MPATLQSPGVSVSIINESFYTPAAPGTVPLIVVASASNKVNPSGVTAPGTKPANIGKVYNITSQRDLNDTFGIPTFYTDTSGNPIHGSELNEYGLQAAYSLLGVSSAAYVVRAPVDLSQMSPRASAPSGDPNDGSYWLDTSATRYGIFEWAAGVGAAPGKFIHQTPLIIDDSNSAVLATEGLAPKASIGTIGKYAVVSTKDNQNAVWYKNDDGVWVAVGSVGESSFTTTTLQSTWVSTVWATSHPVATTLQFNTAGSSGSIYINEQEIGIVAGDSIVSIAELMNNQLNPYKVGVKVIANALSIYADGVDVEIGITSYSTLLTQFGLQANTYARPKLTVAPHTRYPNYNSPKVPSGGVYVKTTTPDQGANWTVKRYSATSRSFSAVSAKVYSDSAAALYQLDTVGGGTNIPVGTLYVESNYDHGDDSTGKPKLANFKIQRRAAVSPTVITSAINTSTVNLSANTLGISITEPGSQNYRIFQDVISSGSKVNFVTAINNANIPYISAANNSDGSISITHSAGGDILFREDTHNVLTTLGFTKDTTPNYYSVGDYEPLNATAKASNWKPLSFVAAPSAPQTLPASGQLWYNSIIDQVDIMIHDGQTWKGYRNVFPSTDPAGPIVSALEPTKQSDGVTDPVNGDIWISTADIERYGKDVYVYNGISQKWQLQDVTDNTSPNGWLFHDARWATSGSSLISSSIKDLLTSNYLDPDAPDPAEYPQGMRLWNLRRSGFNIKEFKTSYIDINANNGNNLRYGNEYMGSYSVDRWVSISPNHADGSGTFGRFAQRGVVVKSLKQMIDGNQSIRDTDTLVFNLISTPGYPEVIQNMIGLNQDRGLTAFVIGDTPMRLKANGTDLQAYGFNSNSSVDNDDAGLVSYNEYMAAFYPSGYTTDLTGAYIIVPPSHMMLRTIAISDQKSYPWFAPAGIRRGVVDNVSSVGYLEAGEFKPTALPQSIRDVMSKAGVHINPIATITGAGIINFGQYTRANAASALDRINVARLVVYLRRQLDILARPFLFEPNDKITRNEIKNAVQSLLLELVGQRALYDFIVVCDESNNTPARIDRSELWVDVAIEPVKAVEFIYIPVRLVNTGAIKAKTYTLS
jgi:hypothetical protein